MKTTELYLEQVFVGFMIIFIALAPWLPEIIAALPKEGDLARLAGIASAAIGLGFLIGIPFDRLSDTLTERLDTLQRLTLAFEEAQKPENRQATDPFAEDALLLSCLGAQSSNVTNRLDYHRSRIRLSRALAAYLPAMTVMAAVGISRPVSGKFDKPVFFLLGDHPLKIQYVYAFIVFAYAAWMVLLSLPPSLPRTRDDEFLGPAKDGIWIKRPPWSWFSSMVDTSVRPRKVSLSILWLLEWQTWLVPLILLISPVILLHSNASIALVSAIGTAMTALAAWSAWRIGSTYRKFLLGVSRLAGARGARA